MNCNLLPLLAGTGLLPDRLARWVNHRWVEPHLRACSRCRTELARMERLDQLFRETPAEPALLQVATRTVRAPVRGGPARRWPRYAMAGAGTAAVLFGLFLTRPREHPLDYALDPPAGRSGPLREPHGPASRRSPHQEAPFGVAGGRPSGIPTGKWHGEVAAAGKPRGGGVAASLRPGNGGPPAAPEAPTVPDEIYLDGRDPHQVAEWLTGNRQDPQVLAGLRQLPQVQDDFVRVPLPLLANTDPKNRATREAVRKYQAEAKVVDARLFRKVTLKRKGDSLEEFCRVLEGEAGVRFRASRGVAEEKLTIFVEKLPARDVMRAVARLFGYYWVRSGSEGAYQYELRQDLKLQLAEEELRNQDLNAALLAVDTEMQAHGRDLDLTLEQLRAKAANATGKERERAQALLSGGWGVAQVYRRLTPAEIDALRGGQMLTFSTENAPGGRLLPPEWRKMLAATSGVQEFDRNTGQPVEVGELPDARVLVDLRLKRSELGQVTLEGASGAFSPSTRMGGGLLRPVVVGQSPSVASPDNARANAALRNKPPFTRVVTIRPEPECPNLQRWYRFGTTFGSGAPNEGAMEAPQPHVSSAEVWEEIHKRSGLPIVADYYTRQYPLSAALVERAPLFDALSRTGDRLGVRWRKDGEVILCRSTGYFWDKLKEVPERLIRRWQEDRLKPEGLPLRDLLEMASLSNYQLNSTVTAAGMRQCYDLEEWGVVGGGENRPMREYARFLALLPLPQLNRAQSAEGLPLADLAPEMQREWLRFQPHPPPDTRLRVDYVPAGAYVWVPVVPTAEIGERLSKLPVVYGKTVQEAVTVARRHYPEAEGRQFRRSLGVLSVTVAGPGGEITRAGKPPVLLLPSRP